MDMIFRPVRHLSPWLLAVAVVVGGSKLTAAASTLYLEVQREGMYLKVKATLDEQSKEIALSAKAIDDLSTLYTDLESRNYNDLSFALSKKVGILLLSPFESFIDRAEEVHFIADAEMIHLPFDLLPLRSTPLFLQKPVSFGPLRRAGSALTLSKQWSALAIRDRTADPENGTSHLRSLVRASRFHGLDDIGGVKLGSLAKVDVLLVSAHGHIGKAPRDFLTIGKQRVIADDLARLSPKLVYLDSCRLGASIEFINAFRRAGTLYYVAPILSNEAGKSSTRTIQIFFNQLAIGKTPSEALCFARRTLFKEFKDDSPARRLWRSFPFRVYSLN
jgi:hypothetical protein